ncbi:MULTISPECIES: hypothetical protein [Mesorhizobium]|nr:MULTISPECIES: hypothetical protein [Mesorhizobium]
METDAFDLYDGERTVRLCEIRSAYFRRPQVPELPSADQDRYSAYRRDEWLSLLKSLYLFLENRWLSHPSAILLAEDKPRQLRIARSLGFDIPETLISNSFIEASRFAAGRTVIGKPLRNALVQPNGEERVIFTTRLPELVEDDKESVAAVPVIYQVEIPKVCDIRVTVVGERVFAVTIDSQSRHETVTDWRKGSFPDLIHQIVCLPKDVEAACVDLTRRLNLRFGAIDLVLDHEGRYWFLECNPNGQWAWIENRTGLAISAAIVDELERIGRL